MGRRGDAETRRHGDEKESKVPSPKSQVLLGHRHHFYVTVHQVSFVRGLWTLDFGLWTGHFFGQR
jgi:hypothetical protein